MMIHLRFWPASRTEKRLMWKPDIISHCHPVSNDFQITGVDRRSLGSQQFGWDSDSAVFPQREWWILPVREELRVQTRVFMCSSGGDRGQVSVTDSAYYFWKDWKDSVFAIKKKKLNILSFSVKFCNTFPNAAVSPAADSSSWKKTAVFNKKKKRRVAFPTRKPISSLLLW